MYQRKKRADKHTSERGEDRSGDHTVGAGSKPAPTAGPYLTPLSSLGEFGLIDRLTGPFMTLNPSTIKGVGDDAAVIGVGTDSPDSAVCLVSTDLLVEGIHFDMTYTPLKHLGYKAVAVNASDIAAMNGIPQQITVSIAVSSRFSAEALDEIYSGIRLACEKYRIDLVGGDTSSSTSGLIISVTVIGTALREEIVYRSGARAGDLICVSGDLGSAYIGMLLLEREKKVFEADRGMQPQLAGYGYQVGRFLKPEPRTDIRTILQEKGVKPTSMIDISDGLASEVLHLCKQSDTGCRIWEDKIPVDAQTKEIAMEFRIIPSVAALSGGEDYELLFTVQKADLEKISNMPGISVIGHMTGRSEGRYMITSDGKEVEITAQGWEAF